MRSEAADDAPSDSTAVSSASEDRPESLFPFSSAMRHRSVVVGCLLVCAAAVITEYALSPPAYHAMAIVDAPAAAAYEDPGGGSGTVESDREVLRARQGHAAQERSLLIAALNYSHERAPVKSISLETHWRRSVPRLTIRRTGRSDIVRLSVVATTPIQAAHLANVAALILVSEEQKLWRAEVSTSLQTGTMPPSLFESGAAIRVITRARRPRLQRPAVREAASFASGVLIVLAAACWGILAVEWWLWGRKSADDAGSADSLVVPIVGLLRVPKLDQPELPDALAGRPTFSVESAFWTLAESFRPMESSTNLEWATVIVVAPCDAHFYAEVAGSQQCRSAAVFIARLAASRNHKVLLIDADLSVNDSQSPGIVDMPKLPGFAEAITGYTLAEDWLLEDQESPNLIGLSAGRVPVSRVQLGGESIKRFLSATAGIAEWIVVAAGPVLGEESVREFWLGAARWADMVVLINETGFADAPMLKKAAAFLLEAQVPVIGQVTWSDAPVEHLSESEPPPVDPAAEPAGN